MIKLIQDVEGSSFHSEDRENESYYNHSFLSSRQMFKSKRIFILMLVFIFLANFIEIDFNFDSLIHFFVHFQHLSRIRELSRVAFLRLNLVLFD